MGDYGVKFSQAGYNVATADDAHTVYTSKYPTLKIWAIYPFDFTTSVADQVQSFKHWLGYVPVFKVVAWYYVDGAGLDFRGVLPFVTEGGQVLARADSSNIYIVVNDVVTNIRMRGSIYIFADRLE